MRGVPDQREQYAHRGGDHQRQPGRHHHLDQRQVVRHVRPRAAHTGLHTVEAHPRPDRGDAEHHDEHRGDPGGQRAAYEQHQSHHREQYQRPTEPGVLLGQTDRLLHGRVTGPGVAGEGDEGDQVLAPVVEHAALQAPVGLRAVELEPDRVGGEHQGQPAGDPEPGQERAGGGPGGPRPLHRVRQHDDQAGQSGEQQHLLVDEDLVRHQRTEHEPVAAPPARLTQGQHPHHDQREQEVGNEVRLAVGVVDDSRREAEERAADERRRSGAHQVAGEHPVPGAGGGRQRRAQVERVHHLGAEQHGQRSQRQGHPEQRGVGHHVHPVRGVLTGREQRVLQVPHRVLAVREQPLEPTVIGGQVRGDPAVDVTPVVEADEDAQQHIGSEGQQVGSGRTASRPPCRLGLGRVGVGNGIQRRVYHRHSHDAPSYRRGSVTFAGPVR
ncbi:hypothetical protein PSN01_03521 [Micromonospora saelicesensis]|nr:hypothetical protein PSN01_03521 [Micromonospora saelicesensis]